RLPEPFKIRRLSTKWLLKAAFVNRVPRNIRLRGKQGFGVPIGAWLRNELRGWVRDRLLDNRSLSEWFRPVAVQRLLEDHEDGRVNNGKRLWALAVFAVWLDKAFGHNVIVQEVQE